MPPCTDRAHEQRTRVRSNGHINDNQLSVWWKSDSRQQLIFQFISYKTRISEPIIMSFMISDSKDKLYKLQLMKYHHNKYVIIN